MMNKNWEAIFFAFVLLLFAPWKAYASGPSDQEIVFVLDASNSMNTNDPEKLAGDSVKQMAYSLPSNYRTGFVAYNDGVAAAVPPARGAQWGQMEKAVDSVVYKGYTDTGAGLAAALDLFDGGTAEKTIILLTDGEVIMNGAQATQEAQERFEQAVRQAEQEGIPIYLIALGGELDNLTYNIFTASEQTGGEVYRRPSPENLQETVRGILFDVLDIKKTAVGLLDAAAGKNSLSVRIPAGGAAKARILVTADGPLGQVQAEYQARGADIVSGKRFAVVELSGPREQEVAVHVETAGACRVRAELMTEYEGSLLTEVEYPSQTPGEEETASAPRFATIRVTLADGEGAAVLNESSYEGKTVRFLSDGKSYEAALENGCASFAYPADAPRAPEFRADFSALDANILTEPDFTVSINPPAIPAEAPKPNYIPLIVTLGCLFAALLLILVLWLAQKKTKDAAAAKAAQPPPFTTKYDFAGRVSLYVTRSPDEDDVAPRSFNLYRLFAQKEITLQSILDGCGLKQKFPGAERILFRPGQKKSLVVLNRSDCTILKSRELVIQDHGYPLYFGEKLHITFEDEASEMEVHYKDLTPAEKR